MLHPISIQILYLGDYKQHIAYPPQCREEAVFGQVRGHRVQRALLILYGGVSQGGRRGQSPEEGIQWPQGRGKVLQASVKNGVLVCRRWRSRAPTGPRQRVRLRCVFTGWRVGEIAEPPHSMNSNTGEVSGKFSKTNTHTHTHSHSPLRPPTVYSCLNDAHVPGCAHLLPRAELIQAGQRRRPPQCLGRAPRKVLSLTPLRSARASVQG